MQCDVLKYKNQTLNNRKHHCCKNITDENAQTYFYATFLWKFVQ